MLTFNTFDASSQDDGHVLLHDVLVQRAAELVVPETAVQCLGRRTWKWGCGCSPAGKNWKV